MEKDNDIMMDGIDERIEAFLRGQLSTKEESSFKQAIKNNPILRDRIMTMVSLIKGIREKERRRENAIIDSINIDYNSTECINFSKCTSNDIDSFDFKGKSAKSSVDFKEKSGKSKVRYVIGWACSIAAVFAIFFGIQIDKRYKLLDDTISPYYTQYAPDDISRGDTDSVTVAHLYDLFNQIQKQRYVSSVIKELELIYASLDADFTYAPYANDIAWNLALAYIKNDETDKAIPVLEKLIADNPDSPIASKAEKLLNTISAM